MNKVILTGRLTRDWERNDSSTMLKNTLAVERYKDGVDFVPIVSFNEKVFDTYENYTGKGSKILVEGKINVNKNDEKTYTSIIINSLEFLDNKKETQEQETQEVDNSKYHKDDLFKEEDNPLWD